jgi:hypothetical protein
MARTARKVHTTPLNYITPLLESSKIIPRAAHGVKEK